MNRIDRLFAILLVLQRRHRVRAEDLARHFEVSKRTIYRDLLALSESGVPIAAIPHVGFELLDGFSLPPLIFTPAEASALFWGAQLLATQARGQLPAQAAQALDKIAAILPRPTREQVDQHTQAIHCYLDGTRFDSDDPRLALLRRAVIERRVIRLRYHSYSQNQATERVIEPQQLVYSDRRWYVTGYCRTRRATRSFRLERIEDLHLLDETFTSRAPDPPVPASVDVRVRFAPHVLRWVREGQHYGFVAEEATREDGAVMLYRVHSTDELHRWLLSWGAAAEVIEPASLRDRIRGEATALVQMLT